VSAGDLVASGNLLVAVPVALLAGIISFASPCILPLVPGYLGYLGGSSATVTDAGDGNRAARRRLLWGVALFVLGFALIFVAYNAAFGALGFWLLQYEGIITRILGVVVIVMGLIFIGLFGWFQNIAKPSWRPTASLWGAFVLGLVFGIGWTPCTGPVLAVITSISLQAGSAWIGVVLGFAYAVGLGIPFLLIALGVGWFSSTVAAVRRHIRIVNIVGGALLVVIGILMVTGVWSAMMSSLQAVIAGFVPAL
jgi:cytochrome c-type biogenesis protein